MVLSRKKDSLGIVRNFSKSKTRTELRKNQLYFGRRHRHVVRKVREGSLVVGVP